MGDGAAAARVAGAGVADAARATPGAVAVAVDGGPVLTYAEWERRAGAVAGGLAARSVRPGDRVALRFDLAGWADFAVAHLAVRRAGAVAVLVSPGAAAADAARAVAHAGVVGVLAPAHLAVAAGGAWVAAPAEVGDPGGAAGEGGPADPGALAEVLLPTAPLARPVPDERRHVDVDAAPTPPVAGPLVHGWAPGTPGGRYALAVAATGAGGPVVAVPGLAPARLGACVAEHGATTLGLPPAVAAAVVASGGGAGLGRVRRLLLSGPASPELRAGVARALPAASIEEIGTAAAARVPAEADRKAPVAVSQEPMLWHEQLAPGSFNLPCLVRRYEGPLDVAALGAALADLARRHEPLRTTFTLDDGAPRQVVGPPPTAGLRVVDLADLAPAGRDAEAGRILADASARPFDLVEGPLFDPWLLRLGDGDHVLVVRLHHTTFDDWSVDLFRLELSALYAARLDGSEPALPALATPFAGFARHGRAVLDGDAGAAQRAWWRDELRGAPLAVQLPLAGAREGAGEPVRLDLAPPLSAAVRALAPRLRATPYMTVLAAFGVVVGRYTGQDDLVLSSVVAHRGASAAEPLIGCFTKKVPLRLRLGGDPTFPELVARTRAAVLGALAHQDVGFDAVVQEALGPAAAAHGAVPQVNVVFQGETPQRAKVVLPGVSAGPYEVSAESRKERHFSAGADGGGPRGPVWGDGLYLGTFVLVSLVEAGAGLSLVARGRFPRPAGRRLLGHLEAVLAEVVAAPDRPVSELGLGTDPVPPAALAAGDPDVVDVRGLRARRSRLEAALARCPGVAEVAVAVGDGGGGDGPRLVAYVVPGDGPAPSLGMLRHALWTELPGSLWPAAAVVVDAVPRRADGSLDAAALPLPGEGRPDAAPEVAALAALWGEVRGGAPPDPSSGYWQDFSFLPALAEARQAGMAFTDEQVARNRTLETLAADLAASRAR